jgi:hypothetical protein
MSGLSIGGAYDQTLEIKGISIPLQVIADVSTTILGAQGDQRYVSY